MAELRDDAAIQELVAAAERDFKKYNARKAECIDEMIPDGDLEAIQKIVGITPLQLGVIDAVDNWVTEVQKDVSRLPNENEWNRLQQSPLNGKIGMSFALQWRYNFGRLFGVKGEENEAEAPGSIA